jgi:hypothetical protein
MPKRKRTVDDFRASMAGRTVWIDTIGYRFLDRMHVQPSRAGAKMRLMQIASRVSGADAMQEAMGLLGWSYDLMVDCLPLANPEEQSSHLGLALSNQTPAFDNNVFWFSRLFATVKKAILEHEGDLRILVWRRIRSSSGG